MSYKGLIASVSQSQIDIEADRVESFIERIAAKFKSSANWLLVASETCIRAVVTGEISDATFCKWKGALMVGNDGAFWVMCRQGRRCWQWRRRRS
jgi:hypothetical protein